MSFFTAKRVFKRTLHRIPTIDPMSGFFHAWAGLLLVADILSLIYIPYKYSFDGIRVFEEYAFQVTCLLIAYLLADLLAL